MKKIDLNSIYNREIADHINSVESLLENNYNQFEILVEVCINSIKK